MFFFHNCCQYPIVWGTTNVRYEPARSIDGPINRFQIISVTLMYRTWWLGLGKNSKLTHFNVWTHFLNWTRWLTFNWYVLSSNILHLVNQQTWFPTWYDAHKHWNCTWFIVFIIFNSHGIDYYLPILPWFYLAYPFMNNVEFAYFPMLIFRTIKC